MQSSPLMVRLHGLKWPFFWRWLHRSGWSASALAILTGIVIVWSPTHARLIGQLMGLRIVHTVFGAVVAIGLGIGSARAFPRRWNRLDWLPSGLILGVLSLSGIVLLTPTSFPNAVASFALPAHLWATWAFAAWAAFHVSRKLLVLRIREGPYLTDRRRFIGSTLKTFLAGAAGFWILPQILPRAEAAPSSRSGAGATEGSWQFYTVTGSFPRIDPARYRLTVDGLVRSPMTLSLEDLKKLTPDRFAWPFHCVTGWVVSGVRWEGVAVATLLRAAGMAPGARYVVFRSADGVYRDSLSMADIRRSGAILAYRMDGAPVTSLHGGPVRLFVPNMYGYKSVKWVDHLTLATARGVGTWESYGYPDEAWISGSGDGPRAPA